jgi:hypothetical protein
MLTDAQVDRYSRQILLDDVGGRGQARLLAARVAVAGESPETATAAALLARAGVGTLLLPGDVPSPGGCRVERSATCDGADVVVDLTGSRAHHAVPVVVGRRHAARAALALVVGRPCAACLPADVLAVDGAPDGGVLVGPAAMALGALAASEALRALLLRPAVGRRHLVDLTSGCVESAALAATAGCPACGAGA